MEKEEINDRIIDAINYILNCRDSLSKTELAKEFGFKPSKFSEILNKRMMAGTDVMSMLVRRYKISPQWLLTGDGEMLVSSGAYGRINEILQREGLSEKDFARGSGNIGLIYPNIYKNAQNNPGDPKVLEDWTNVLLKRFPQYSKEWIMYGTGNMFASDNIQPNHTFALSTDRKLEIQDIPLYDLSATAGIMAIFNDASITPDDFIRVPNLPPVDGAIYVRGESMTPLLKSGDIIIYKKLALSLDSILWGQIYLLSFDAGGDTFTVVKYIQKSDDPERIRLVSHNSHFEPKDIPLSSIRALAIVKASITFHTIE